MADTKVSELTSAASVGGSDVLYLVQSNTSKKVTVGTLFANAGNANLSGRITLGGTPQTLTTPGAINLETPITHLSADATGGLLTIAQGSTGQIKVLTLTSTSGGAYTLSNANIAGSLNISLDSVGDTVILVYTDNKWYPLQGNVASVGGSNIDLTNVSSNIIPSANSIYDLGSPTNQWRSLYVSNNTIYIGGAALSINGNGDLTINGSTFSPDYSSIQNAPTDISDLTDTSNLLSRAQVEATGINSNTTITITNTISEGSGSDIIIESADDIRLQGKNREPGQDVEGGDINIFAGNGANDDGVGGSSSAGDIVLQGGAGGNANTASSGGAGGFVTISAGNGGDGSATNSAGSGNSVTIQAGDAGADNGGGGNQGGAISINAGDSTDGSSNGGEITLRPGNGANGSLAGSVEIVIPSSDTEPGGTWAFNGSGTTLSIPGNSEISSANFGNVTLGAAGNVFIRATQYSNLYGAPFYWKFADDGILHIPGTIKSNDTSVKLTCDGQFAGTATLTVSQNAVKTDGTISFFGTANSFGIQADEDSKDVRLGDIAGNDYTIIKFGSATTTGEESDVEIGTLPKGYGVPASISLSSQGGQDSVGYTWTFDGVGSLKFPNGTYQNTAFTGNANVAATVDVTNTNGLGTTYYLTFVEGRTTEQIVRADVDLTYNTADNKLTTGNIELSGNLQFSNGGVIYGNPNAQNSLVIGKPDYPVSIDGTTFFNSDVLFTEGIYEKFSGLANATSVVTHNCDDGHIFYHTTPSSNFTVNLTNLGLFGSDATTVTLVINQGITPYYANALQIGGTPQTIKWQGNTQPTGNANAVDVQTFSILSTGGQFIVLGQLSSFG